MSNWKQIIADAKELLDIGAITQEEFDAAKQEAFAFRSQSNTTPPSPPPNLADMGTRIYTGGVTPTTPSGLDDMGTMVGKMGGDVVGSHKIIELLGKGGMGSVYRGRHTLEVFAEAEGDVAIKMILPSLAKDEAFRNRFIREASLGKKLNHPNIAKVVSIYSSDDVLALVMEYIEGKELKDLIPEGGMSVDEVVQLLKPIASALDYLHEQRIVHRDMKPANVRVKPDGTPVILDFGIAKDTNEVDSNMTQTGTAMGTQTYMAPEQMDAKRVTGAADQYALAMMAYQMLSGRLPWDEDVSQARLGMIKLTSDYQTLIAVCSVSEPQNDAVMKGLSLQPEDRYETCVVLVETLDSAASLVQLEREVEAERLAEQERLRVKQEAERLKQERLAEDRERQQLLKKQKQNKAEQERLRGIQKTERLKYERMVKESERQKEVEREQQKIEQERLAEETERIAEEVRQEIQRQQKAAQFDEQRRAEMDAQWRASQQKLEREIPEADLNSHSNDSFGLYTNLFVDTHVGGLDSNEDFGKAFRLNNFDVLIVCDGIGRHEDYGDWASQTAVNTLERQLEILDAQSHLQFDGDFLDKIDAAIQLVNNKIYTKSQRSGGMIGTTLTIAIVWKGPGPKYIWIGWCGDSKIYMMDNSTLEKIYISFDHNHQRLVSETDPHTPLERPYSLNRAIGIEPKVDYDYLIFELDEQCLYYVVDEDTRELVAELSTLLLLLCSDGLTRVFEEVVFPYSPGILDAEDERILSEIKTSIDQNSSPEQVVESLIDVALQGRTNDNVTVGILTISLTQRVPVFAETSSFDCKDQKDKSDQDVVVESAPSQLHKIAESSEEQSNLVLATVQDSKGLWKVVVGGLLLCGLGFALMGGENLDPNEATRAGEEDASLKALREELRRNAAKLEEQQEPKSSSEEPQLIAKVPDGILAQQRALQEGQAAAAPVQKIVNHALEGENALRARKWSKAIESFNNAYQTDQNPEFLASVGYAQFKSGQLTQAKKSLLNAVKKGSISANKWLGYVMRDEGDIAGSNVYFHQYLKSNPSDAALIIQEMMQ